jgi:hypothetical protein
MTIVEGVPGYWPNEQSGVLRPAIEALLNRRDELSPEHVAALRAYLRQWIFAPGFQGKAVDVLRGTVDWLADRAMIERWLDCAIDAGVDPL